MTWGPEGLIALDLNDLMGKVSQDAMEYELPGPAEWWPEGYNVEEAGFWVPSDDTKGYIQAFNLAILDEDEVSKRTTAQLFATLTTDSEKLYVATLV
jgi:hypothetical protein